MLKRFNLRKFIGKTTFTSLILLIILVTTMDHFGSGRVKSAMDDKLSLVKSSLDQFPETCKVVEDIDYLYYESAVDGEERPNNKFGLYIYAENNKFFDLAEELVNSNGGDWGYVLIPYNVKDRDYDKWQRVFATLYEKHLIPVIQLHDVDVDDYKSQTKDAAEFLDEMLWPVKQRYISVYNEPNDAKFWYGRVDPAEYAQILDYTVDTFKAKNYDFFMLNGAFNISTSTNGTYMDAFEYMRRMDEAVPDVFKRLDGWASHPYPQPEFSGSPADTGRWSIKAYEDELKFLQTQLDIDKELPVFITETGWVHAGGENYNGSYLDDKVVAEYFKLAFEDVWLKDARVVAVMPFTIRYDPPFDHFSWVNKDNVPYIQYEVIKKLPKVKGKPLSLKTAVVTTTTCVDIN